MQGRRGLPGELIRSLVLRPELKVSSKLSLLPNVLFEVIPAKAGI
jgi:hypothetical protein